MVISGHQCGKVPAAVTACDHMATQIPPSTTWGHTFFLNPLSARLSGDLYRFATNLDNTVVTITCVDAGGMDATEDYQMALSREVGSNWGEFQTHPVPCSANVPFVSRFCCLQSSNPIVLAQYSYGHELDTETFTADLELVTSDDGVQINPPGATIFISDDDSKLKLWPLVHSCSISSRSNV